MCIDASFWLSMMSVFRLNKVIMLQISRLFLFISFHLVKHSVFGWFFILAWGIQIDGNGWSENQSIKLVNCHGLSSIGTGPQNRRHARCLFDHLPFLGSPGNEIGKTIPTQSSQCKEYTPLHMYSNVRSLPFGVKMSTQDIWVEALLNIHVGVSSKAISSLPFWGEWRCQSVHCKQEEGRTRKRV